MSLIKYLERIQWICWISLTLVSSSLNDEIVGEYQNYNLSFLSPQFTNGSFPRILKHWQLVHPKASYLSLHFKTFQLPKQDVLIIRSRDSSQKFIYSMDSIHSNQTTEGFFAHHIVGDVLILEYLRKNNEIIDSSKTYGFEIDSYAHGLEDNGIDHEESICMKDNSLSAVCFRSSAHPLYPVMYHHSRALMRLLIQGRRLCTGFLVGCQGHVMTNHHCIRTRSDAINTDYEILAENPQCTKKCRTRMGCPGYVLKTKANLISTHRILDYSLIHLKFSSKALLSNLYKQTSYFRLETKRAKLNEKIYLPNHPMGWAKRISFFIDNRRIANVSSTNLRSGCGRDQVGYMADTRGGSSGSPVVSLHTHKAIAIHRCGGCPNSGTHMSKIVSHLKILGKLPWCSI